MGNVSVVDCLIVQAILSRFRREHEGTYMYEIEHQLASGNHHRQMSPFRSHPYALLMECTVVQ